MMYKKATMFAITALCSIAAVCAQNGTYQKKEDNGAYCVISFQQSGNHVKAEIFSWWNTPSAQNGNYSGAGEIKNNTVLLQSDENDPDCKVRLSLVKDQLKASFGECNTDHLPTDFNGLYQKITEAVAGEYAVTSPKAYFYKNTSLTSKQKAYVIKGDKVRLDIDRIAASKQNWVYVYFTNNSGKDIPGYMLLTELKRVD
ncbi:hypothetical protein SAMN06265348_113138 [Pedobacter westerhofensis]|uniref:SH3 domain-containing protein n=1 Tax=Pedobacter westerhofensis TaxID=425512 RepID=A0A521FKL3_9SPHI|nr:hypothetical protein [Pedobacter westerhofensis]SMO96743.1 hypothetical protein SAMN06265348_113138 [Pedobacter westerhofensis]